MLSDRPRLPFLDIVGFDNNTNNFISLG